MYASTLSGFFHGHAIAQLDYSQVCAVCGHHSKSTIEELLSAFLGALGKKTKPSPQVCRADVLLETYLRDQQYECRRSAACLRCA